MALIATTPTYEEAYNQALREGRPFVVFVGVPPMPGPWLSHHCHRFDGVPGRGVILSISRGSYMEWVDTMDWWSTEEDIQRRIRAIPPAPPVVRPSAPVYPAYRPSAMFSGGSC